MEVATINQPLFLLLFSLTNPQNSAHHNHANGLRDAIVAKTKASSARPAHRLANEEEKTQEASCSRQASFLRTAYRLILVTIGPMQICMQPLHVPE